MTVRTQAVVRWAVTVFIALGLVPGSVGWQQGQAFSLTEVARRDYKEISPVKRGDIVDIEPLGESNHACVHCLKAQRCVCVEKFGHTPVIMRRYLDYPELVVGDRRAEFCGQARTTTTLRIGQ